PAARRLGGAGGGPEEHQNDREPRRAQPPVQSAALPHPRLLCHTRVVFPSFEFAIFFPLVLAGSWVLMPRPGLWKPFVLAASYVFYAAASIRYCLLLGGMTLVNQLAAVQIQHAAGNERRQRWIVGAAVAFCLGVLGVFKY